MFKISPDETLKIIQELYEKKLVTYPRTDARVLSTAVAKEIHRNIGGLRNFAPLADFAANALENGSWKQIARTKYVNDKQITDHYAIIPTGQGFGALRNLNPLAAKVYELIGRRFLSIFYPPAVYQKFSLRNSSLRLIKFLPKQVIWRLQMSRQKRRQRVAETAGEKIPALLRIPRRKNWIRDMMRRQKVFLLCSPV